MNIALYPRVSTQEQATNGFSMDEQIERMRKYCEAMGWTVYKVYPDAGFSGANTDRPALQRMIKDIKAGKIDKVLVYKLDRLSRSQKDTLELIEDVFLENNTDFVSMSENFDTSTPFGRAMIGILAVFAQLEREQIKERMLMGKEARAKKGLFHGSAAVPTGYRYANGELVPHEFEKMQVITAFEMAAQNHSPYVIADTLNEKGLYNRAGAWRDTSIRRILRNKVYIGYIRHNKQWYKGTHDRFISDELFFQVQDILNKRHEQHMQYNRRAGKATTYLGGFLNCAQCGAKYSKQSGGVTMKNGEKYRLAYFACISRARKKSLQCKDPNCQNRNWRVDELTDAVFNEIRKLAIDPNYITEVQSNNNNDEQIKAIESEINKLDEQISRLLDLYTIGQVPLDTLQDKVKELNDKKGKLETELDAIHKEQKEKLSNAEVIRIAQTFDEVLARGDFDEIRSVIAILIEKIELNNDIIDIHWNFV